MRTPRRILLFACLAALCSCQMSPRGKDAPFITTLDTSCFPAGYWEQLREDHADQIDEYDRLSLDDKRRSLKEMYIRAIKHGNFDFDVNGEAYKLLTFAGDLERATPELRRIYLSSLDEVEKAIAENHPGLAFDCLWYDGMRVSSFKDPEVMQKRRELEAEWAAQGGLEAIVARHQRESELFKKKVQLIKEYGPYVEIANELARLKEEARASRLDYLRHLIAKYCDNDFTKEKFRERLIELDKEFMRWGGEYEEKPEVTPEFDALEEKLHKWPETIGNNFQGYSLEEREATVREIDDLIRALGSVNKPFLMHRSGGEPAAFYMFPPPPNPRAKEHWELVDAIYALENKYSTMKSFFYYYTETMDTSEARDEYKPILTDEEMTAILQFLKDNLDDRNTE